MDEVYSEVYCGSWRKYTLECIFYQEGSILWSVCCIMKEVNSGVMLDHEGSILCCDCWSMKEVNQECMLDHEGSIIRSVCWIMKEVYSGVYVGS